MNRHQAPTLESENIAIVLVGDFNPAIFHPAWFAVAGLLRRSEAEQANVDVIHPDIASFSLDWIRIKTTRTRFSAEIQSVAYQSHLKDLVEGAFTQLRHTPTRQLGINRTHTYRFQSDEDWHAFGHFLAPKSPWFSVLKTPGLQVIHIQGARQDSAPGYELMTVSAHPQAMVSIQANDHWDGAQKVTEGYPSQVTDYFTEIIRSEFDQSLDRSNIKIKGIIQAFQDAETIDDGPNRNS